ncbi:hypothetical protein J4226_04375 [Candidatus Pacearchaeota archaeon]|nr:hypothetical protein [Candidatus Pacearchaeota archaeon]
MLQKIKTTYLKLEQKISCAVGRTYKEIYHSDTHGSGGLDKIITDYNSVTGDIISREIILSKEARSKILKDIRSL